MHHWTDLAESFLKMYGFAMLRTAGQNLYQVYHCVHYFVLFIIYVSTGTMSDLNMAVRLYGLGTAVPVELW